MSPSAQDRQAPPALSPAARTRHRADIFRAPCDQPCLIADALISSSGETLSRSSNTGTPLAGHLPGPREELAGRGARRSWGKALRAPRERRGGSGAGIGGQRHRPGPARCFSTADSAWRPGGAGSRGPERGRADGRTDTEQQRAHSHRHTLRHGHGHSRPQCRSSYNPPAQAPRPTQRDGRAHA